MEQKIQYGQYVVPPFVDMVNFGVGQPSNSELPLDIIKKGCLEIEEINDKSLLQYGDIPGYLEFRKVLSEFLEKRYTKSVNPDNLFVTNGVTGALSLICSLYTKSCKRIYVEEPTYFLAINIFKEFGFEVVSIKMENDGLNLEDLDSKLSSDSSDLKLLYTIPTFHNPTSITLSDEKRKLLSKLSEKYNVHIIADEVYQMLYFKDTDKPPSPLCYYSDNVYSISSFSKILAPSLRLGWIQSSNNLLKKLKLCGQLDSSGGINPFISRIVHNIIKNGDLDTYLDNTRQILYDRCTNLVQNLKIGEYNIPKGGYFVWVKTEADTVKMLNYCSENKVKYHSGNKFSGNGKLRNFMRLSFSFYEPEGLAVGANRLNDLYKYYMENVHKVFIGVHGSTGKLGSKISSLVKEEKSYVFSNISRDIDYKPGIGKNVIIDVTTPEGTKNLLTYLMRENYFIPIIIGTTGNLPMDLIKLYSEYAPVALISNFSYGIPLLEKTLKNIDYTGWNVTITETHHKEKVDSPSGTAKSLASIIGNVSNVESIREDEVFGIHKVKLENENEIIEFNHFAKNRDVFASGSLRYVDWILEQIPDIYNDFGEEKLFVEKWNGCGNTFLILDEKYYDNMEVKVILNRLCSETNSDGIIYYRILKNEDYDFEWKYLNRDNSLVEMCGNGSRCVSKFVSNKLKKDILKFRNNFGIEQVAYVNGDNVEVVMPKYDNFHKRQAGGYFIKVGVPHFVMKVDNVLKYDLAELYNKINNELAANYIKSVSDVSNLSNIDLTWERCNVNIYSLKDNLCYIRTFEKGVEKETGSCGSGCCAVFCDINADSMKFSTTSGEAIEVTKRDNEIFLSSMVKREFKASV